MTSFQIILVTYFLGGIISNFVGYIGKELGRTLRKERLSIFDKDFKESTILKLLHISLLTIALRGIVLVLWFPLWVLVVIDSNNHPERFRLKKDDKVKRKITKEEEGLFFFCMGGHGEIRCSICGFSEEITSFTHGFGPNSYCRTGYQCQSCGEFHMIENLACVDFDSELIKCNCGGTLSRDNVIFCPKCKQKKMEYRMIYIT